MIVPGKSVGMPALCEDEGGEDGEGMRSFWAKLKTIKIKFSSPEELPINEN